MLILYNYLYIIYVHIAKNLTTCTYIIYDNRLSMKIVIASNNQGKIKEFKDILGDKFEIYSMKEVGVYDDIVESGATFLQNATIKAEFVHAKTGLTVIADDSGLCVDSLNGEPGVFSARYAGENATMVENKKLLLNNLQGKDRKAYFVSCLVMKGEKNIVVYGKTEGEILFKEEGENGFGYDSLFYSYDLGKSFGVATDQEKNAVSHRARAIKNLLAELNK